MHTVFFIRHGETDWNAERRMQGQREADLTARGREQAETNARAAAALGVDAIYASPLRRARQSAEPLARRAGLDIVCDDRLKEWRAGDWSGCLYTEIPARWPAEWAAWRADMWTYRPPGAENFEDLLARGGAFLDDLLKTDGCAAVVSHGFIGRAMMSMLAGLEPRAAMRLNTANAVFFRFRRVEGSRERGRFGDWTADRFEAGAGPLAGLFEEGGFEEEGAEKAGPSRLA